MPQYAFGLIPGQTSSQEIVSSNFEQIWVILNIEKSIMQEFFFSASN